MTAVKRMTTKSDFLKMQLKDRNCEVEEYEDCRTRHLVERCDCVPVEVPGYQASNSCKCILVKPQIFKTQFSGKQVVQPNRKELYREMVK